MIATATAKADTGPSLDLLLRKKKKIQRVYMDDGITEAEYASRVADLDEAISMCCPTTLPQIEEAAELLQTTRQHANSERDHRS
ncbi:MAG: hypothetical protein DK306_001923 [Chloroflexi bacterium]|nr:MAG: hypothetical protein DK306_001923 [Chloroflexota bacterium]